MKNSNLRLIKKSKSKIALPEEGQVVYIYERKMVRGPCKKDENLIRGTKCQTKRKLKCKVAKVYPSFLSVTYTDRYNNPQVTSFLISDFITHDCTFECVQE
jgi:uncharacterized protein Veg